MSLWRHYIKKSSIKCRRWDIGRGDRRGAREKGLGIKRSKTANFFNSNEMRSGHSLLRTTSLIFFKFFPRFICLQYIESFIPFRLYTFKMIGYKYLQSISKNKRLEKLLREYYVSFLYFHRSTNY